MKIQPENRQALEEAAAWFVDFRVGDPDRKVRNAFMQWLLRSPENVRAYYEITKTYAGLPRADTIDCHIVDQFIERLRAKESNAVVPLPSALTASSRKRPSWRWTALAASVAGIAVISIVAWVALTRDPVYATGIAEQRSFNLEDGSKLELNARTRVRVRFTDHERRIDLLEGQALFRVFKDPSRPFVVRGGDAQVTAVGTQFDVHLRQSGTTVTVIEGRVAVQAELESMRTPQAADPSTDVANAMGNFQLSAGEQAVITETAVERLRRPSVESATAWTKGELEFDETPLADAIEDFNRHSRIRLVLDGPPPTGLSISGIYSSNDARAFVRFLRAQPDLVVTESNAEVRIRRK